MNVVLTSDLKNDWHLFKIKCTIPDRDLRRAWVPNGTGLPAGGRPAAGGAGGAQC